MTEELKAHMRKLARRGGKSTAKKYGLEYMRMLAKKAGKESGRVRREAARSAVDN